MTKEINIKLVALHRHWIVADAVRAVLRQKVVTPKQEMEVINQFGLEYLAFGEHASMVCRLQVWYALLYVVIEGYKELGIAYPPLDSVLVKGDYVDLLRRFRNATFHFQADPLNDKLIAFLEERESEIWIGDLNKQLDAFLVQALPIKETVEKLKATGLPEFPSGTKLDALIRVRKE